MANTGNIATISGIILTDSGIDLSTKADLVGGLVPSSQLPSYVDDILEYAALASFPATGEAGKIYVDQATNKIYRWSGSVYVEVSAQVGTTWGGITGTLSNQTDLQTALNAKQASLSGTGFVKSTAGVISYDTNTYLTVITSAQVTTALGYTPYNATNPSGYITSSALAAYLPLSGGTLTGALSGTSATFTNNITLSGAATNGLILQNASGGESPNVTFITPVNKYNIDANASGVLRFFTENTDGSGGVVRFNMDSTGAATFSSSITAGTNITAGSTLNGASLNISGTQSTFRIASNYIGGGDLLSGTLMYIDDVLNNNLTIVPSALGTNGSKIVAAAFNGSAWRSMWEFNNVNTGNPNLILVKSGGNVGIGTTTDAGYKLDVNGTGRFTGALSGTSATFSGAIAGRAGGYLALYDISTNTNRWDIYTNSDNSFRMNYNGSGGDEFTIASTGAATFSSSVTTGGNITATADGSTGGLRFTLNNTGLNQIQYALVSGGIAGDGNFALRNGSVGSNLIIVNQGGQLRLNSYTASSSFSGTAAGYLAFDSSGNVITVAGVASAVTSGFSITSEGVANNTPSTPSVNAGVYAGVYAFLDLATQNANGGWIDFSKGDGSDFAGRIRYYANPERFGFHTAGGVEKITFDAGGNIVLLGGSSSAQSTLASGLVSLRFPNQYSSGYTDAGVKLYIFNSGTTIQGFTAGPAYDLQYHSSGSDTGRHAFYVANSEVIRFNKTLVLSAQNFAVGSQQGFDNPGGWNKNILIDGTNHGRFRIKVSNYTYGNIDVALWADSSVSPSHGISGSNAVFAFNGSITSLTVGGQTVIHTGNIGSQSVNYASSAGTASNITAYTINQSVGTGNSPSFAEAIFGTTGGASNQGIQIRYQNYVSGYGRIRFYQSDSNHATIHVFSDSWQGGGIGSTNSAGAINIDGSSGVTMGGWNSPDMYIIKGGQTYARGYRGIGNVAGTGEATYHPAGIYSTGNNWLYGNIMMNNYSISGVTTIAAGGLITGGTIRSNSNIYTDQNYGYGLVGVYSSYRYQGVFAMGDAYKLPADGSSPSNLYGMAWSHPNAGGVASNLNTHGLLVMENGTFLAAISGSIRARDDMRAPIFYDSNDSGYYGDFASTSRINIIRANKMRGDTNGDMGSNGWWAHDPYGYGWGQPHGSFRSLEVSSSGDFNNEPAMFRIHQWGSGAAEFWKPKGTILYLRETPGGGSTWFTKFEVQGSTNVTSSLQAYSIQGNSNVAGTGNASYHPSGIYSTGTNWLYGTMYMSNNSINDVSNLYGGAYYATNWFRAQGDCGLYSQDYGGHIRRALTGSYGNWETFGYNRNGWSGFVNLNNYNLNLMMNTSGDHGFYVENGSGWTFFFNRGNHCAGIGTDNTWSGDGLRVVKQISAEYGFTTWSDRRAKENITNITSALSKVLQMRGVYFNYIKDNAKVKRVGFIAQELQAVLPEVVNYAEEIDEYNVNYSQIVSVLAEAMKEQQNQINELKSLVNQLLTK